MVLLAGPSGGGKTYLAEASGLPIVALDDFYRNSDEPDMPLSPDGHVDWEDPRSWNGAKARAALVELCRHGRVEVPHYDLAQSRAQGHRTIDIAGSRVVIAEGIFAADLIEALREEGLLADALLISDKRRLTFVRRLLRDLREGRKPPLFLVKQGWAKTRSEPAVIQRLRSLGARPITKPEALKLLADLAS